MRPEWQQILKSGDTLSSHLNRWVRRDCCSRKRVLFDYKGFYVVGLNVMWGFVTCCCHPKCPLKKKNPRVHHRTISWEVYARRFTTKNSVIPYRSGSGCPGGSLKSNLVHSAVSEWLQFLPAVEVYLKPRFIVRSSDDWWSFLDCFRDEYASTVNAPL